MTFLGKDFVKETVDPRAPKTYRTTIMIDKIETSTLLSKKKRRFVPSVDVAVIRAVVDHVESYT